MKKIDQALINEQLKILGQYRRKRFNLNFHEHTGENIHRMLQFLERSTYVQAHKHENPDKTELFFALQGTLAVVEFDDKGIIKDHFILDVSTGNYICEISPGSWHTLVCLSRHAVVFEVKDGPWDPETDKTFAPWAPQEGSSDTGNYLEKLRRQLKVNK